jgi:hypothetical protein
MHIQKSPVDFVYRSCGVECCYREGLDENRS